MCEDKTEALLKKMEADAEEMKTWPELSDSWHDAQDIKAEMEVEDE